MAVVYIAFGSNLKDRRKNIQDAICLLKAHPKIKIKKISSVIETKPEGAPRQKNFLNGVVKISTALPAGCLLEVLQAIEAKLGRKRRLRNGPRTIDLDILFYGKKLIRQAHLEIPHPRLDKRAFVLKPLCQIAPDFVHPVIGERISAIARRRSNMTI